MYEVFEHTADLGLRIEAADLATLFREAAEGLFSVIAEGVSDEVPAGELHFALEADRVEYLLVDWLSELLYVFDTRRLLLGGFAVTVQGTKLEATARGRALDEQRDRLLHEVKAVTYHALRVDRVPAGWLAEIILDI